MNDLQRSAKSRIELQDPATKAGLSKQTERRMAIYVLAASILGAMIAWFYFLGWGAVTMLQWVLDSAKIVTNYF
jgi:hypothetical protein